MKIEIERLEVLFGKILGKLREMGVDHINVKHDFYWLILNHEWTIFDDSKREPAVGSLVDDWQNLVKVSNDEQIMTFVDFDRMSSILRAMSEELNSEVEDPSFPE